MLQLGNFRFFLLHKKNSLLPVHLNRWGFSSKFEKNGITSKNVTLFNAQWQIQKGEGATSPLQMGTFEKKIVICAKSVSVWAKKRKNKNQQNFSPKWYFEKCHHFPENDFDIRRECSTWTNLFRKQSLQFQNFQPLIFIVTFQIFYKSMSRDDLRTPRSSNLEFQIFWFKIILWLQLEKNQKISMKIKAYEIFGTSNHCVNIFCQIFS